MCVALYFVSEKVVLCVGQCDVGSWFRHEHVQTCICEYKIRQCLSSIMHKHDNRALAHTNSNIISLKSTIYKHQHTHTHLMCALLISELLQTHTHTHTHTTTHTHSHLVFALLVSELLLRLLQLFLERLHLPRKPILLLQMPRLAKKFKSQLATTFNFIELT